MAPSANTLLPGSKTLHRSHANGIPFFRFHHLSQFEKLEHFIFTRHGGVSSAPFASLNVSYGTGDEAGKVRENMRRVRAASECSSLLYASQSHSTNVEILRQYPSVDTTLSYPLDGKDGFITQLPGVLMMIKVADCQAILLYDTQKEVASIVHAGWRGSVKNIAGNAVRLMEKHFRSNPLDIMAGVGPSLGPCCAEFRNWPQELPPNFSSFQVRENHFDFWAISQSQLMGAGLSEENIEIAGLCTKCHPEVFYSYRGEGETGRFAVAIGIKNSLRSMEKDHKAQKTG